MVDAVDSESTMPKHVRVRLSLAAPLENKKANFILFYISLFKMQIIFSKIFLV